MRLKNWFVVSIIITLLSSSAHAQEYYNRSLTDQEIERIRGVKELLDGVDTKSLRQTIREVEKSRHPEISIEMQEAMAKAYTDIVSEFNVQGLKKKEWLYSMICLNMAYFQFGGDSSSRPGSTTELNRLIRQKLIKYLPPDALKQPGFVSSLE